MVDACWSCAIVGAAAARAADARGSIATLAAAALLACATPADAGGAAAAPALGQPVTPQEIEVLSITVFPDGAGLPPGAGSVRDGAALYAQRCAGCHGARGIEGPAARLAGSDGFIDWGDPVRPLRIRKFPVLVLSVGAQWPYATSLFDYIRRAMPHPAPKSLTDDEVYAVTGYVLHLNGLVSADATLDRASLPRVVMPGRARSVSAWPAAGAQMPGGATP